MNFSPRRCSGESRPSWTNRAAPTANWAVCSHRSSASGTIGTYMIVVNASRYRVSSSILQSDVDAIHSIVRGLDRLLVAGLLNGEAERKHSVPDVMIEFCNNRRSFHGRPVMNLFLSQLNGETNNDGGQACDQIANDNVFEVCVMRDGRQVNPCGDQGHDETTKNG